MRKGSINRISKETQIQASLTIEGRSLDIRVSTAETIWGEKVVLRLLDRSRSLITLERLGFGQSAYQTFVRLIVRGQPYRMLEEACRREWRAATTRVLTSRLEPRRDGVVGNR